MIAGRNGDGHKPNAGDTEVITGVGVAVVEVVQLFDDAIEITNTVAIAIVKAADKDFIENAIIPPWIITAVG